MTRVNLPGWYGLGSGLEALGDLDVAREAYREWPVFAALVDVAEMSLAKTDDALAGRFLALGGRPDLAATVLDELQRTRRTVLRAARPGRDARAQAAPAHGGVRCGGRSSTC